MATPIITSVTREVFETVPGDLKEASYALGATRWEMVRQVVLPYSRPGIVGATILGLGRAIGEAIAVAQVIGGATLINASLFHTGGTLAAQIASQFQGSDEQLQKASLAYLGLILLVFAVVVNVIARIIVQRGKIKDVDVDRRPRRRRCERQPARAAARSRQPEAAQPLQPSGRGRSRRSPRCSRSAVLVIVVGSVFLKGVGALSWHFLTTPTALFGETGGGISNAIVGSAIIVAIAAADGDPGRDPGRDLHHRVRARRGSPTRSASSSTSSTGCRRSSPASSSSA